MDDVKGVSLQTKNMSLLTKEYPEPPLERAPWQSEKAWEAAKAIREKLASQSALSLQEAKEMAARHCQEPGADGGAHGISSSQIP